MDDQRPNRFLIAYKAVKDSQSDMKHLCVEAHYRSEKHALNRVKHLMLDRRRIDTENIQILEYKAGTLFWELDGITARFVVDMKTTGLKHLREML